MLSWEHGDLGFLKTILLQIGSRCSGRMGLLDTFPTPSKILKMTQITSTRSSAASLLAAAEVVAAAGGQPLTTEWRPSSFDDNSDPMTGPPISVQEWLVRTKFRPDQNLVELAERCVSRVLENSEIRDEWLASDAFAQWRQFVDDLAARLARLR